MTSKLLAFAILAALATVAPACTSSVGAPACNALAICCGDPNIPDPSSCSETAMSGELTDASCGAELEMYQQSGACLPDAATGDASH